jgi:hypothetical protein
LTGREAGGAGSVLGREGGGWPVRATSMRAVRLGEGEAGGLPLHVGWPLLETVVFLGACLATVRDPIHQMGLRFGLQLLESA